MKKKIILISIILIIIAIIMILLSIGLNKEKPENNRKVSKKNYVNNVINDEFYNKDETIKELETTIGSSMIKDEIFIGKDSAIRHKPSNDLIKQYKLNDYIVIQEKLATKVEKRIIDNVEYKAVTQSENYIDYEIKPWYFYNYSYDLSILTELIMNDAGFVVTEKNVFKEDYTINEFKARVKALIILDNSLTDYDNVDNEIIYFTFHFRNNKASDNQFLSLYYNLEGATSKKSPNRMNEKQQNEEKEKMIKYLKDAETNGLYNKKNPYKI